MNTFCRIYKYGCVVLAMAACLVLVSCGEASLDYNHPDVELFVKQLRTGKYSAQSPEGLSNIPKFAKEDIEELLKYAEDLTVIPSFPLAPVSYSAGGKLRLGECIMVHVDAENYEGIYFLTDEEVLDAAARYRRWWEGRKYPRTMWTVDPCYDEPLCGSGYMWW